MFRASTRIPRAMLEKLQNAVAGGNLEEVRKLVARLEKPNTSPNEYYNQLFQQFENLELIGIRRQDAVNKYTIPDQTIARWEKRGAIRVIQKAKRRGLDTIINERDIAALAGVSKKFRIGRGPISGFRLPIKKFVS